MAHIDLNIDVGQLAAPGRKQIPLTVEVVRPLEDADLVLLATSRETKPGTLVKRLTQRHHGLARSLAAGVPPGEAAIIHGYEPSRVSILQGDPAFQELVSFYAEKVDEAFEDVVENMAALSKESLNELHNRFEEDPEGFTNKELLTIAAEMLDRTGHGKRTTQVNVNVDLSTRLEAARKRALEARINEANEAGMKDITPADD